MQRCWRCFSSVSEDTGCNRTLAIPPGSPWKFLSKKISQPIKIQAWKLRVPYVRLTSHPRLFFFHVASWRVKSMKRIPDNTRRAEVSQTWKMKWRWLLSVGCVPTCNRCWTEHKNVSRRRETAFKKSFLRPSTWKWISKLCLSNGAFLFIVNFNLRKLYAFSFGWTFLESQWILECQ